MASEITVSQRLQVSNGNLTEDRNASNKSFDQAAVGGPTPGMQVIGTSEESNTFAELTVLGWLHMTNLDASNYVEWGFATGVYGGRLEAGETACFRLNPGTTLFLKANTLACKVNISAFED